MEDFGYLGSTIQSIESNRGYEKKHVAAGYRWGDGCQMYCVTRLFEGQVHGLDTVTLMKKTEMKI